MRKILVLAAVLLGAPAAMPASAGGAHDAIYVLGAGQGSTCLHSYADGGGDDYPGVGGNCFVLEGATSVDSLVIEDITGLDMAGRYTFMAGVAQPISQGSFCGATTAPVPVPADAVEILVDVGSSDNPAGAPCALPSLTGVITITLS